MNRKIFVLLTALILQLGIGCKAYAQADDDSSDYLKIFTPQHSVKEVFLTSKANDEVKIKSDEAHTEKVIPAFQRQITENEFELVAKIVYAESRGEPFQGKIGVASVVLNRLEHPKFPKSIEGVIYEKNAFSCLGRGYNNIKPDIESYNAVNEALSGNDPTDDAVFFYNPKTASSKWMKRVSKDKITTTIGNHVFFK